MILAPWEALCFRKVNVILCKKSNYLDLNRNNALFNQKLRLGASNLNAMMSLRTYLCIEIIVVCNLYSFKEASL